MDELSKYFLYPAALFASKTPTAVSTILGTCVTVCLFDPVHKIGGINHFMLPSWDGNGLPHPKYGDYAMNALVEKMINLGADQRYLRAKVYGGLCRKAGGDAFNIGSRNAAIALKHLAHYKIPITARDLGGYSPRKLNFETHTGIVKVDLLLPADLK